MIKKLKARLRSERGESLTEVLIALMVSSLALVMLALMIQSTNAIVHRSKVVMKKYMKANNVVVEKADASPEGDSDDEEEEPETDTGGEPAEDEEEKPAVSSSNGMLQFLAMSSSDSGSERLMKLTDDSDESIGVVYYINNTMSDDPVVSYKKGS